MKKITAHYEINNAKFNSIPVPPERAFPFRMGQSNHRQFNFKLQPVISGKAYRLIRRLKASQKL